MARLVQFLSASLLILLVSTPASALRLCADDDFEPFSYREKGAIRGIDVDIVEALFEAVGTPIQIRLRPWKRLLAELQAGRCEGAFSMFETEKRRQFADYIKGAPIHRSVYSVFVKRGHQFGFTTLKDLQGKKVSQNSAFAISGELDAAVADGKIQRIFFDNPESAFLLLLYDRVDAILDNHHRFSFYLNRHPDGDQVLALPEPIVKGRASYLVLSKAAPIQGRSALIARLNETLSEMDRTGLLLKAESKYLGPEFAKRTH